MRKIAIGFALAAILAGCDYGPDSEGGHTSLNEQVCQTQPNACAEGTAGYGPSQPQGQSLVPYDPTAPLFGSGPGSYVPGTNPLEVMAGG